MIDDLRERAKTATREYVEASEAMRALMGLSGRIDDGRPPAVIKFTRETLAEWDAAEAREARAKKEWRDAMAAWSESRGR